MIFREITYSVLLVSASDSFNGSMLPLLPMTEYYPVTTVKSVGGARRAIADSAFDIVLINSPLPDDTGTELAIDVCRNSSAGVLLFVKSEYFNDIYPRVMEFGVMTISKPTNMQMVKQNLRILCATRERLRQMEARQATVEEKIEEIRLVNKAKWLLIESLGMTESDAHRYIEKQAMDLRITKRDAAENVIRTYRQA